MHGGQIELRLDADPLVHEPDAQAVVDVVEIVEAAEEIEDVAALRLAQAPERVGVADQQRDLRNARLLLVESIDERVDVRLYDRTRLAEQRDVVVADRKQPLPEVDLEIGDLQLLEQRLICLFREDGGSCAWPEPLV